MGHPLHERIVDIQIQIMLPSKKRQMTREKLVERARLLMLIASDEDLLAYAEHVIHLRTKAGIESETTQPEILERLKQLQIEANDGRSWHANRKELD